MKPKPTPPKTSPAPTALEKTVRRRWVLFITLSVMAWILAIGFALYYRLTFGPLS